MIGPKEHFMNVPVAVDLNKSSSYVLELMVTIILCLIVHPSYSLLLSHPPCNLTKLFRLTLLFSVAILLF